MKQKDIIKVTKSLENSGILLKVTSKEISSQKVRSISQFS